MASFDSIPFGVLIDSPDLPGVEPSEGSQLWLANIRIDGNVNFEALRARWVRGVIVRPALGTSDGGAIIVPGLPAVGSGFGDLVIPGNQADEQTWRAVLSEFRPIAAKTANLWRVQVTFICGDRVS